MEARFGRERALEVCKASSESVEMIESWCSEQGVDAWFTRAGYMLVSTAPAHDAAIDAIVRRRAPQPRARLTSRSCATAATRRASGAG